MDMQCKSANWLVVDAIDQRSGFIGLTTKSYFTGNP